MLDKMLTALDISIILNKFNLYDDKVSIIGCPEHLYKNIIKDNSNLKTYICFYKSHWFVIVYLKNDKLVITLDSFGSSIPKEYKKKILEIDNKINFFFCFRSVQTDGFSCGLFAIVFVLFIFYFNTNNSKELIKQIKNIKKKNILKVFNKINNYIF